MRISVVAFVATVLIAGCDITAPYACTASVEPGIVVEIVDGETGEPIAASARGIVTEGVFQDSLAPSGFTHEGVMVSRSAAHERDGTYAVFVSHPDYELWAREGVRVREGKCHVETVTLRAALDQTFPRTDSHLKSGDH